jgi:hypothetical protein
MMTVNEDIICASQDQCVVPGLPRASAHNLPGCGHSIHALCGHLNDDASIRFKTTCFHCYEKFGKALKDPEEAASLLSITICEREDEPVLQQTCSLIRQE